MSADFDTLPPVLKIADLARVLRCSVRTLQYRLARGQRMPKEMPRVDSQHRWLKAEVIAWMTRDDERPQARPHLRSHRRGSR